MQSKHSGFFSSSSNKVIETEPIKENMIMKKPRKYEWKIIVDKNN